MEELQEYVCYNIDSVEGLPGGDIIICFDGDMITKIQYSPYIHVVVDVYEFSVEIGADILEFYFEIIDGNTHFNYHIN